MSIILYLDDILKNEISQRIIAKPEPETKEKVVKLKQSVEQKREINIKYQQQYKLNHNDVINCPCGGVYKSYYNKNIHVNTNKHQKYLDTMNK